jgi:hypothetical protein
MTKPKPLPPLSTLEEVFSYNPETGALTRRVTQGNASAWAPAGWLGAKGYIQVQLGSACLRVHRVAWALHHGADPGPLLVDHINRNRSDNRACNLRLVDARGNRANSANLSPVQVTYPNGQTRLFPSTKAAAAALGCSRSSIYRYVRGQQKHPGGLRLSCLDVL